MKPVKKVKNVKFDELSDDDSIHEKLTDVPVLHRKLIAPIHLPIILVGMFHYDLVNNVKLVMVKGYMALLVGSLVYGYLIIQNSKDLKKKSQDNTLLLLLSSILLSILISLPIFFILILLGCPVSDHLVETFYLANHLSLIIVNPVLNLFKLDLTRIYKVIQSDKISTILRENPLLLSGLSSIIGTWCGVIPIPLDWDRPWQNWPITLLVGGYSGCAIGSIISLFI